MVRFASCQLCKGAVIRQSICNTHICIRIWANSWIHRKIIEVMALEIWWTDSGPIGMRCLIKTHFGDIQFYGTIYWAPLDPYSRHLMFFFIWMPKQISCRFWQHERMLVHFNTNSMFLNKIRNDENFHCLYLKDLKHVWRSKYRSD